MVLGSCDHAHRSTSRHHMSLNTAPSAPLPPKIYSLHRTPRHAPHTRILLIGVLDKGGKRGGGGNVVGTRGHRLQTYE